MREERFDIEVIMRDGAYMPRFKNAKYVDEGWCVRIVAEDKAVRINKNSITCMTLYEVSE